MYTRNLKRKQTFIKKGTDGIIISDSMYPRQVIKLYLRTSKISLSRYGTLRNIMKILKFTDPNQQRFVRYEIPPLKKWFPINRDLRDDDGLLVHKQVGTFFVIMKQVRPIPKIVSDDQIDYIYNSLMHLHLNCGITHNDLVDNIMMDNKNRIVIIDWDDASISNSPLRRQIDLNALKYMFKKRYPTLENVIEYKKKIEKDYHNEVRAMMPQQQINPQIIEIFDISDSDDES